MLVNNKINLISFPKLKPTKFFILLKYNELIKEVKLKMAHQLLKCIFDLLNKFLNILIDKLPKTFLKGQPQKLKWCLDLFHHPRQVI
jgi:hypothetical protein